MRPSGAYKAERASALSGVPESTIHYWARTGLLVPGVSASRVKLWSYTDLVGLRTIYWLRQKKTDAVGAEVPATSMKSIRRALERLGALDEPLWHPEEASVWVDAEGALHVRGPAGPETAEGQQVVADALNLIAPFTTREGLRGPDLARPRPGLRIVPGKLAGSPHVAHTRLETRPLWALAKEGLEVDVIATLYPFVSVSQDHGRGPGPPGARPTPRGGPRRDTAAVRPEPFRRARYENAGHRRKRSRTCAKDGSRRLWSS